MWVGVCVRVCVTQMPDNEWCGELSRILNIPERHFVTPSAAEACSVSSIAAVQPLSQNTTCLHVGIGRPPRRFSV